MTWRAGVDVVSFGATKNGAMTADAVVIFKRDLTEQLRYRHKRAGQLASKMRFHSAQLAAYLHNDLWLHNATHANIMAARLRDQLSQLHHIPIDTTRTNGAGENALLAANIVFCQLPLPVIAGLCDDGFAFYHDRWEPGVCRFVTSFQTQPEDIDDLTTCIRQRLLHHYEVTTQQDSGPSERHQNTAT